MRTNKYGDRLSEWGCGKLLDGLCYYCYGDMELGNSGRVIEQYRTPAMRYYCGDNGGFLNRKSPGRLCPDCTIKAGLLW